VCFAISQSLGGNLAAQKQLALDLGLGANTQTICATMLSSRRLIPDEEGVDEQTQSWLKVLSSQITSIG
jgi:hypothetical protein